jgi:S1-C subfamily serine protease
MVGDRILRVGEKLVTDNGDMRATLQDGPAKTKLVVERKGAEVDVPIEFTDPGPTAGLARRLGVRFGEGLVIDVVTPGGIADQGHVRAGDRLVKIGDTVVDGMTDSTFFPGLSRLSGSVKIAVRRDGNEVILTVVLPERP